MLRMDLKTTVVFLLLIRITQGTQNALKLFNEIDRFLNNKMCTGSTILFQESSTSPMLCSMFCKAEETCFGVFYESGTKLCVGCKGVKGLVAQSGTILLSEHEAEHCYAGWKRNDLSCYLFSTHRAGMYESQQFCETQGAHLVYLDSYAEFSYLNEQNNGKDRWVGITDQNNENRWVEIGTGNSPSYEPPWASGEPNNGREGNCAHTWSYADNYLADFDCTTRHFFICEKELYTSWY